MDYQSGDMLRFTIFGIPVEVQPFFWITLVIIGGVDGSDAEGMFRILLFVLAGFISILTHELGHALTARKFGAHSEITLQAFGGYAAYSGVRMTRLQSFLTTAAGPGIQILLGLGVWFLIPYTLPGITYNAWYFLKKLMGISLVWAVLNLLPILPLDGGQMLNAVLGPQRIRITLWVTIIVSVLTGVIWFEMRHDLLFSLFLSIFAWKAWQALQQSRWR